MTGHDERTPPATSLCVGDLMRAHDWTTFPSGPPEAWPNALRAIVGLALECPTPMFMAWGEDLRLLYNDAYAPILGERHPAALGARFRDVWADVWNDIAPFVSRTLSGEAVSRENLPLVIRRGDVDERTWFSFSYSPMRDDKGAIAGLFCTCTETTAAEVRRREADALYRAYFENTAEALFVLAVLPDGGFRVDDLNPAHQARVGFALEDVRGKRLDEILPADLYDHVSRHYRRVLDLEEVIHYTETFTIEGQKTLWDTVLVPVRNSNGRIVRIIGAARDLTAQQAAQEQLRQAQKMEAIGQLTGGVAHDFNNLLTPIVATLDILGRKRVGGEREQRLIEGAAKSADRARTLVQRLLAFARRQPLQPASIDVGDLARGVVDLIQATLGPQIRLVFEAARDLPPAMVDPNQLEMAILNLAVNARDAMPEGGVLRICVVEGDAAPGMHPNLAPGRYLRLSVADTGVGMDEETLKRAAEPFFSTKGVGKGTGLGLSMAHGLASQSGGALIISSTPGLGTNVELWLPRAQGDAAQQAAGAPAQPAGLPRAGLALIVDDEEAVRVSTAEMLTELGYEVRQAASAEDAMSMLDAGLAPALLVTDHLMPGMPGAELARKVAATHPAMRVIVVSGYAETDAIAPDLRRLTKPFTLDELSDALAALD